jgi:hypothetical protein
LASGVPKKPLASTDAALAEEVERADAEAVGDPLYRLEGEVALASFESAHVRAVYVQDSREGLLRQTTLDPESTQVAADGTLQVALHASDPAGALLDGLQTDE